MPWLSVSWGRRRGAVCRTRGFRVAGFTNPLINIHDRQRLYRVAIPTYCAIFRSQFAALCAMPWRRKTCKPSQPRRGERNFWMQPRLLGLARRSQSAGRAVDADRLKQLRLRQQCSSRSTVVEILRNCSRPLTSQTGSGRSHQAGRSRTAVLTGGAQYGRSRSGEMANLSAARAWVVSQFEISAVFL
jgi:hypothetical protein